MSRQQFCAKPPFLSSPNAESKGAPSVEIFFDGDCPLCTREIRFLEHRNRKGAVLFTDITRPNFDAAAFGATQEEFMARIRGRLGDGTMIEGVDVFRHVYAACGFAWLVPLTRFPGISHALDAGYRWFAANRLRLTGRCDGSSCAIPANTGALK